MSTNKRGTRKKKVAHISDSRQNHNGVLRMIMCIFQSFLREFCTFAGPVHPNAKPIGKRDVYLASKLRSRKDDYYMVKINQEVLRELDSILETHDIVHLHSVSIITFLVIILLICRLARRRFRPKSILHVHTHYIDYVKQRYKRLWFFILPPMHFLYWLHARVVNKVIFSNRWTLRQLGPRMWLWRWSKKVVIWRPEVMLDKPKISLWKDKIIGELPRNIPFLLFAGRVAVDKHLPELIRLFASIASFFPDRLNLVIAGEGDPTEYRRLAKSLGIEDRVYFLGRVSEAEVSALSQRSIAAITCCPNETLGLGLLKQMGCGTLAIVPKGTVFEEFITRSRGGYILIGNRKKDIANIAKILASKRGRVQMGKRAQRFVLEHFSIRQYELLDELYDELIMASRFEASHICFKKRPAFQNESGSMCSIQGRQRRLMVIFELQNCTPLIVGISIEKSTIQNCARELIRKPDFSSRQSIFRQI